MRDNAMNDRDEFDLLLDSALATYANPEPSHSLAARILTTTRNINRRPFVRWLPWTIPALAALLLAVLFIRHHAFSSRTGSPVTARLSSVPGTLQSASRVPSISGSKARTAPPAVRANLSQFDKAMRVPTPRTELLPRQEVFPTPAPLTPQEQALAALVNRNASDVSSQVAQSAPRNQEQPIEPLSIAAIHIPPLNPPDNGAN
jgi:hypothetical protein